MPTAAGKDKFVHLWTAFIVGLCIGAFFTVCLLGAAFMSGHDSYVASAWTLIAVSVVVGGFEIVRAINYPGEL